MQLNLYNENEAMSDINIGKLITDKKPQKDAIHVALAPVEAGEALEPGQHVGLNRDNKAATVDKPIGIVDPFLKQQIMPGDRFWLFMYPKTVTDLRHEWTHPAFVGTVKGNARRQAMDQMANMASDLGMTYTAIKRAARYWLRYNIHYTYLNSPPDPSIIAQIPEFWKNYELVTKETVPEEKRVQFFYYQLVNVPVNVLTPIGTSTTPLVTEILPQDEDDGCSGC